MNRKHLLLPTIIFILTVSSNIFAQKQIGISVKSVKAYILEFKEPFNEVTVDILDNNFTKAETVRISITPKTVFKDKDKKQVDRKLFRRGTQIEITGERLGLDVTANEIKALISLEKTEINFKGYFEFLEGDKAWIDGKAVKLDYGAKIKGEGDWKNKKFESFDDMMLGSEVEVKKAVLKSDGVVYATEIETKPNLFTDGDKNLKNGVSQSSLIENNLKNGRGKVLGKEVKFVENLDLQTYVTKVGNKLVPRYQKDLSGNDAAKISFRFMVIEDDNFNAFALPDGSIFVNTGLLRQIKTEAQLAAVLGHEIAHVTHEHSRKRAECFFKCEIVPTLIVAATLATGDKTIAAAGILAALATLNNYGRNAEDQADRVGLLYMSQAGYDPREATNVWRAISKEIKEDAVTNFIYSNHSMARDRVKNLNREIAYGYYDTDFSKVKKGDDQYNKIVGGFFGWYKPSTQNQAYKNTTGGLPQSGQSIANANIKLKNKPSTGDDGFRAFFNEFKKAASAGNRIGIKNKMSDEFLWAEDGETTKDEAIKNMDSMKFWKALELAVQRKPSPCNDKECKNRTGYKVALTKPRFVILFERQADGEWKWSAILDY